MARQKDFRPLRKLDQFPALNPEPFDSRSKTFIPELSIGTEHIRSVSAERVINTGIKVYRSTVQVYTTAVADDITFDTVVFNQGFVDPGSSFTTVTVPRTGIYLITVNVEWEAVAGGVRVLAIEINGNAKEGDRRGEAGNSRTSVAAVRSLTEGDAVGVNLTQTSGGDADLQAGEDNSSLSVFFLGRL